MRNPFKRSPKAIDEELARLFLVLQITGPDSDEYEKVVKRIDQLNKIRNRTSELKKTVIPALGTIGAVTGIYALQQFAGVIVPKALETIAARQEQKKHQESE
jgi:hypothetical protein